MRLLRQAPPAPSVEKVWRLPWPLPAVLCWTSGWLAWWLLPRAGLPETWALACAAALAAGLALACRGRWRRWIAALGFPLSVVATVGAGGLSPWTWLALVLPLAVVHPLRTWRDAPWFPTPARALQGLDAIVGRPLTVHDAGCGMGHGLAALHRLWPQARLGGVEWSPVLAWSAALRCPYAAVRRGDMWAQPWSGLDLVYLFQRPETMARAWDKAVAEMRPGAWLVSLEFAVPGQAPVARLEGADRRPVWIYQPAGPALNAAAPRPITHGNPAQAPRPRRP